LNALPSFEWALQAPVSQCYCSFLGEMKIQFYTITPLKTSESCIWLVKCSKPNEVGRNEWNVSAAKIT